MRRARGYTLIELGVVLGVITILLTAIVATTSGLYRDARTQRTGSELSALARAAAHAQTRNLRVVRPGPTYEFRFNNTGGRVPLSSSTPICYDLTRFPGSTGICPATGLAGGSWSPTGYPPSNPLAAGSPLLALLGGDKIYGGGFNPWCLPYVVCLYTYRAEVLTCVPRARDDPGDKLIGAGLESALACGSCTALAPLTGEPTRCAMASAPTFGQRGGRFSFSYSDAVFLGPIPPTYSPDPSPRF